MTAKNVATRRGLCGCLATIALHGNPPDVALAEAHYRQALALAEELGMRPLDGALPRRPRHPVCHDRPPGAGPHGTAAALDLYRAMDMTFWLPQTEAALAQIDPEDQRHA